MLGFTDARWGYAGWCNKYEMEIERAQCICLAWKKDGISK